MMEKRKVCPLSIEGRWNMCRKECGFFDEDMDCCAILAIALHLATQNEESEEEEFAGEAFIEGD